LAFIKISDHKLVDLDKGLVLVRGDDGASTVIGLGAATFTPSETDTLFGLSNAGNAGTVIEQSEKIVRNFPSFNPFEEENKVYPNELWTVEQVATYLDMTVNSVYNLVAQGKLKKGGKWGRKSFFKSDDVRAARRHPLDPEQRLFLKAKEEIAGENERLMETITRISRSERLNPDGEKVTHSL